jgi:hypothetical protein
MAAVATSPIVAVTMKTNVSRDHTTGPLLTRKGCATMTAAQKTERRGTIAICIAAAAIALAAPAHADNSNTVCPSMGNGITHAQENCPQAPGTHQQATGTYDGHLLPEGYGGKP